MKKLGKRLFSLVLAAAMVLTMLGANQWGLVA